MKLVQVWNNMRVISGQICPFKFLRLACILFKKDMIVCSSLSQHVQSQHFAVPASCSSSPWTPKRLPNPRTSLVSDGFCSPATRWCPCRLLFGQGYSCLCEVRGPLETSPPGSRHSPWASVICPFLILGPLHPVSSRATVGFPRAADDRWACGTTGDRMRRIRTVM